MVAWCAQGMLHPHYMPHQIYGQHVFSVWDTNNGSLKRLYDEGKLKPS
jgi:hypothetical protein